MIKQVITTMAVCFCFCAGQNAWAQSEGVAPRDTLQGEKPRFAEVPNPEKQAKRQTDHLKDALQLTDKQYKKVYKLLLKEQKELLEAFANVGGGSGRPMGGGQPPMGGGGQPPMGGGPGGGQPPMGGGQPPMGGGGQPPMGGGNGNSAEEMKEKAEKRAKKKDKKMKKILTDEQYAKWKTLTPERPERRQPGQPGGEGERPEQPMPAEEG